MVSHHRRDKGYLMNEPDEADQIPEPEATPWPKKERSSPGVDWPPELDERTWKPSEGACEE